MTATSPALSDVEALVADLADTDLSVIECCAILRSRRLNPDRAALADAVQAMRARDGLAGGLIDPIDFLEVSPRPGMDWLGVALSKAENDLGEAIRVLAQPTPMRRVS